MPIYRFVNLNIMLNELDQIDFRFETMEEAQKFAEALVKNASVNGNKITVVQIFELKKVVKEKLTWKDLI